MVTLSPSVWLFGVVLIGYGRFWRLICSSVLGPRLVTVVESSEVVASGRFLLHCFNGSSVGGSRVGRSGEVGRFSEGS